MGTLKLSYRITGANYYLAPSDFEKFNVSLLALGDISEDGEYIEALAAIFDLEAFTTFTNQIDPHLVIPEYLNEFLNWLFQSISQEFLKQKDDGNIMLWGPLPFFAKFLGDGVLFLWDTKDIESYSIGNIILGLRGICEKYKSTFLPTIRKAVSKPPLKLRCGIARGQIISIGDGEDFVGPCINVASRLQKIGQFSFAFSRRGFNLNKCFSEPTRKSFMLIKVPIRGVGDEELVYVYTNEFNLLQDEVKSQLLS